jgi:pimeloyl-ACP methyl ester carboxylesterase
VKETIFILAGFSTSSTALSRDYLKIRNDLKAKGNVVVPVDISWYQKTPSQYLTEFIKLYNKHKSEKNIIIGNSFGALVAFLAIPEVQPDIVYLCSLSPFFKEDERKLPDSYGIRYFGKRRMKDLRSYSSNEVVKAINKTSTNIFVLYGEKEHITSPPLVDRSRDVAHKLNKATLLEIANAPHNLGNDSYSAAVIDRF